MPTREARRRRALIIAWFTVMSAVNLYALYRTQEAAEDARLIAQSVQLNTGRIEALFLNDANTCAVRARARIVVRVALLDDPDTSDALRDLINTDYLPIDCPPFPVPES